MLKRFETGEILFHQGDVSDFAVLIRSGSADVLRDAGTDAIVLGAVHAGEIVGEMGVLDGQRRSATVRAASPLEAEMIERKAFLKRVSQDPELALKLLIRMSARLRDVDEVFAAAYATENQSDAKRNELVTTSPQLEPSPWATLAASTPKAQAAIGEEPIPIVHLPFTVGRRLYQGELSAPVLPDLAIRESEPHRLSRAHFAVLVRDGTVMVRDLNSSLGTIVNDRALGRNFSIDSTPLRPGANTVVAGGRGSPFVFTLTLPN